MGDGHDIISESVEPLVAQTPRGHFYALAGPGGDAARIEGGSMEFHAIGRAPLPDEGFVAVALFATQAEIAVGQRKRTAAAEEQLGHAH